MSEYNDTHGRDQGQIDTDLSDLLGSIPAKQGCDLPIVVSIFRDVKAQRIEAECLSLRQLQQRLTATTAPNKAALPLLKLGTFGDARTEKGNSLRHDANLLSVSGIEGDYDAGAVSPQEAKDQLSRAGVAALIYTTPSHTAEAPRWRVLAPLARQVAPAEREALCAKLNGALGGILAAESFTNSQSYYFGNTAAHPAESFLVEGQPLDRVTGLTSIGPKPKPVKSDTDLSDLLREPADRDEIRRALACISDADYRDTWREIGMALHAEFAGSDEGFDLWSHWSRQSVKFNERDQRRTWKSFRRGGIGIGTLFRIAIECGFEWVPVSDDDFDDLNDDSRSLFDGPKPKPSTLTFLTPDECEASSARKYLIKGLLAEKDVACIFGAPGAGKSLIAPFLGYMVAQGQEAFQMRTKAGGVFYVASEDSHGMRGRVKALRKAHGGADAFKLVEGVSNLLIKESPDFLALKEAVKAESPALIFIDTLAMAFPGLEENSAEAMGRVVAVARALARWGAAVVLIHHDTKSESGTPRGHSVLNGALDVALHVKRDDEYKIIRGKLTKNRNGTIERDIAFIIATEDFGQDEDGDALTYPRCNPLIGAPKKDKKLSKAQRGALSILEQAGGRLTEEEYVSRMMEGRDVSASPNPKSRRDAATRALRDLCDKSLIRFANGTYTQCDGFDALSSPKTAVSSDLPFLLN
ncbi:AAA family ATPase [Paracoccus sp. S1E-3]|uniref:AAA family ATPase n=1 Tax=Paracoccus sp. S1E-3 TaxID=2756130 RepID=UPI0015EE5E2D|nr:AAA family ATPase [Paracoccus sp. S1E-3]MBA4491885.1 AAA family ATPase [Paracoccus sp. S1E-3]